jgi:hypothetical protein
MAVKTGSKRKHNYKLSVEYLTDKKGRKTKIVIPLKDFNKFLERIEDELDIKIADNIMKNSPRFINYDPNAYK